MNVVRPSNMDLSSQNDNHVQNPPVSADPGAYPHHWGSTRVCSEKQNDLLRASRSRSAIYSRESDSDDGRGRNRRRAKTAPLEDSSCHEPANVELNPNVIRSFCVAEAQQQLQKALDSRNDCKENMSDERGPYDGEGYGPMLSPKFSANELKSENTIIRVVSSENSAAKDEMAFLPPPPLPPFGLLPFPPFLSTPCNVNQPQYVSNNVSGADECTDNPSAFDAAPPNETSGWMQSTYHSPAPMLPPPLPSCNVSTTPTNPLSSTAFLAYSIPPPVPSPYSESPGGYPPINIPLPIPSPGGYPSVDIPPLFPNLPSSDLPPTTYSHPPIQDLPPPPSDFIFEVSQNYTDSPYTSSSPFLTPNHSPLDNNRHKQRQKATEEYKSLSPTSSSLNGDAPVFQPRNLATGSQLLGDLDATRCPPSGFPDMTRPPPGLDDSYYSEMKGAYPSGADDSMPSYYGRGGVGLGSSEESVVDASSTSSCADISASHYGNHFHNTLPTNDTQARISFQVKSLSRVSNSGCENWVGFRRAERQLHRSNNVSGFYSGNGGRGSVSCNPIARFRKECYDDPYSTSRFLREEEDENFLDWMSQGGGTCEPFIDSHCHLDFMMERADHRSTFADYMAENSNLFPPNMQGLITNFCYPETFTAEHLYRWEKKLAQSPVTVWQSMGCHPKKALLYRRDTNRFLRKIATKPEVVSIGEIGLDYSMSPTDDVKSTQKSVFAEQCDLAIEFKKPLVIHCRDAQDDCLEVLKRHVPREWNIHCHCFMESMDDCKTKWLDEYPNLYIGLTNIVSPNQQQVAKGIPLDRLLLETDAPYFVPRRIPKSAQISHTNPGMALFTASSIANIRGISLKEVIRQTNANTRTVYNLPR